MNTVTNFGHLLRLFITGLVGLGLGIGLLMVFYGMSMPAKPFIYVGF